MAKTPADQRREVYFAGQVQGVGFRYTTQRLASQFQVTGFVRNLADGRVHLVVEGRLAEVDGLLDQLRRRMAPYIRDERSDTRPATGEFDGFEIRH